jgi:hypothetical protein
MKKISLILFAIAFIIAFVALTPTPEICSWDFRGSLWGPSHMLLNGQTPYSKVTPYGPYPGIWMPHLIGALFPIGWLPCWVAAKLWMITELVGLVFMIWLVAERKLPSPMLFGLCLLLIFLFPPLYVHLSIGQISIFITILLLMIIFLPRDDYPPSSIPWWMSLFLALALAKPQLGILVYPGLLVRMYQKQGVTGSLKLIASIAGWILLFLIPLTLLDPVWPRGFLEIITENIGVPWNLPNLYVQLKFALGSAGIILWAVIFISCLAVVLWLWLNRDPKIAMLWSLALTPVATPYCSSWDFVLMLPLLLWLLIYKENVFTRIVLVVGVFLVAILQVVMRWQVENIPDGSNWWVSISLLVVFILTLGVDYLQTKRLHPVT